MANVDAPDLGFQKPHSGTWGNKSAAHFTITTTAAQNDVLRLGVLPKGAKVWPGGFWFRCVDTDASVTLDVGLTAKNSGAQTDADYFLDGHDPATGPTVANGASTAANKTTVPITLDDDYYVTVTVLGAAFDNGAGNAAARVDAVIDYIFTGHE